jgi:hypothetical protein
VTLNLLFLLGMHYLFFLSILFGYALIVVLCFVVEYAAMRRWK